MKNKLVQIKGIITLHSPSVKLQMQVQNNITNTRSVISKDLHHHPPKCMQTSTKDFKNSGENILYFETKKGFNFHCKLQMLTETHILYQISLDEVKKNIF